MSQKEATKKMNLHDHSSPDANANLLKEQRFLSYEQYLALVDCRLKPFNEAPNTEEFKKFFQDPKLHVSVDPSNPTAVETDKVRAWKWHDVDDGALHGVPMTGAWKSTKITFTLAAGGKNLNDAPHLKFYHAWLICMGAAVEYCLETDADAKKNKEKLMFDHYLHVKDFYSGCVFGSLRGVFRRIVQYCGGISVAKMVDMLEHIKDSDKTQTQEVWGTIGGSGGLRKPRWLDYLVFGKPPGNFKLDKPEVAELEAARNLEIPPDAPDGKKYNHSAVTQRIKEQLAVATLDAVANKFTTTTADADTEVKRILGIPGGLTAIDIHDDYRKNVGQYLVNALHEGMQTDGTAIIVPINVRNHFGVLP